MRNVARFSNFLNTFVNPDNFFEHIRVRNEMNKFKLFIAMCYEILFNDFLVASQVSLLGVDSLWGDCTFIPADWGSYVVVDLCHFALFEDFSL